MRATIEGWTCLHCLGRKPSRQIALGYFLSLFISGTVLIGVFLLVAELVRAIFGFGPHLSDWYHITKITK